MSGSGRVHDRRVGRERDRRRLATPSRRPAAWLRARRRFAWRFLTGRFSSSLTRRIVVLNLGGLVVLVVGFLLLNHFRADIIDARAAEPDDAGRHHRGRGRRLRRRRHRHDHHRSRQAAATRAGRDGLAVAERRGVQSSSRSIPSGSGRCCTGSSRRPTRARGSTTATASCCSTRSSLSAHGSVVRSDLPEAAERRGLLDRLVGAVRNFFATPSAPRPRRSVGRRRQERCPRSPRR